MCFITSLILGILYICLSVLNTVAYHYIKPFTVIIADNTELNIIIKSIWVAFAAFVLYGITIVVETSVMLTRGEMYYTCIGDGQVYTTYWELELFYMLVQCVPMYGFMILSYRSWYHQKHTKYTEIE